MFAVEGRPLFRPQQFDELGCFFQLCQTSRDRWKGNAVGFVFNIFPSCAYAKL
jgi:hypothetical protein